MGSPGWMSTRGTANTLVLIGIHSGSRFGSQAASLLLDMCPTAALIVFGSVTDIDLLSAAYARVGLLMGTRGAVGEVPVPGHRGSGIASPTVSRTPLKAALLDH